MKILVVTALAALISVVAADGHIAEYIRNKREEPNKNAEAVKTCIEALQKANPPPPIAAMLKEDPAMIPKKIDEFLTKWDMKEVAPDIKEEIKAKCEKFIPKENKDKDKEKEKDKN